MPKEQAFWVAFNLKKPKHGAIISFRCFLPIFYSIFYFFFSHNFFHYFMFIYFTNFITFHFKTFLLFPRSSIAVQFSSVTFWSVRVQISVEIFHDPPLAVHSSCV